MVPLSKAAIGTGRMISANDLASQRSRSTSSSPDVTPRIKPILLPLDNTVSADWPWFGQSLLTGCLELE